MASAVDRRARDHRRVAVVDPADDGLLRYIVRHYRYDAMRRERRHVELVADDNLAEFEDAVAEAAQALAARRHVSDTDPHEHISGVVKEPAYRAGETTARRREQRT